MLPAINEMCGSRVLAMLIASSERSSPVTWPQTASLSVYQPGPQPTSRMRGRSTATDLTKLSTFSCLLCFHSLMVLRSCQCCQCQSQKFFCSKIVGRVVADILIFSDLDRNLAYEGQCRRSEVRGLLSAQTVTEPACR